MLRNHLVAEDDSLELKTLTNEGVVMIVDSKRIHRLPLLHFIGRIKGLLHIASKKSSALFGSGMMQMIMF